MKENFEVNKGLYNLLSEEHECLSEMTQTYIVAETQVGGRTNNNEQNTGTGS